MKRKDIEKALARLGATPSAVYKSLKQRGIKGITYDVTECPVARYLKALVRSRKTKVVVGPYAVRVGHAVIELPTAVMTFTARFDSGKYRALHTSRREQALRECRK